jgi:hypothetical protein
MFSNILLSPILGLPLIAYGGILTLILIIITLTLGIRGAPVKTHRIFAVISITLAVIHGILGIIAFI